MCDLGLAAVFSPVGAYTSIAPSATPGRQASLTHSVPQRAGLRRLAQPKAQRGHIRQGRIKRLDHAQRIWKRIGDSARLR